VEIVRDRAFDEEAFLRIATGYETSEVFEAARTESEGTVEFSLTLKTLSAPSVTRYKHEDAQLSMYAEIAPRPESHLYWAMDGGEKVGIAFAEVRAWNDTLWVWELHVASSRRGQGTGRALMETLFEVCRTEKLRAIVCETQTKNAPAIRFYRSLGLTMDGVDTTYYTNSDIEKNDVAIFMKRRF